MPSAEVSDFRGSLQYRTVQKYCTYEYLVRIFVFDIVEVFVEKS